MAPGICASRYLPWKSMGGVIPGFDFRQSMITTSGELRFFASHSVETIWVEEVMFSALSRFCRERLETDLGIRPVDRRGSVNIPRHSSAFRDNKDGCDADLRTRHRLFQPRGNYGGCLPLRQSPAASGPVHQRRSVLQHGPPAVPVTGR